MTDIYEFQVGDYIEFKRIWFPEKESKVVRSPGEARPVIRPAIPAQILEQGGSGMITKLHREPKKLVEKSIDAMGQTDLKITKVRTAKVDAGAGLGSVAAIIDDAILVGKQQCLFDMDAVETKAVGMYGTDAKGGA